MSPAPLRLVFMGTPEFAVPTLLSLCAFSGSQVVGVYTQPDRTAGRGRRAAVAPVKAAAQARGLPCFAPTRLAAALPEFAALRADLVVVAAYGRILPPAWLQTPPHGCLNVHASLLPYHRGASPIAHAILAGDSHSGISLMQMDAGLDTGPVYSRDSLALQPHETCKSLTERLAALGAQALQRHLAAIVGGRLHAVPQAALPQLAEAPGGEPSYAPMLRKQAGQLDFARDSAFLARQVRAFYPWPGSFVQHGERRLVVVQAQASPDPAGAAPGTVLHAGSAGLQIACGSGSLSLQTVKPAGGREMPCSAWLAGHKVAVGSLLIDAV